MRLLLFSLCLTIITLQARAETLGRLFFTPEQRNQLEHRQHTPPRAETPAEKETITVNGVVRRSDGTTTVWINGIENHDAKLRANPSGRSVHLKHDANKPIDLRVGQSLDRATGNIEDPLHGGSIQTPKR